MEENKKQTVEMTAEEAEAFKQFQEKQAKEKAAKKRKEDREAYAQLVDSEIESAIPELRSLSEQMLAVKSKVYENFAEVINIKANVLKLTKDTQRTHTFTHSNGKMRLTLGYNCIDDYRDTVNDGIAIVEWEGMVRSLRATTLRTLGHSVNWRGDQGDWRQLK